MTALVLHDKAREQFRREWVLTEDEIRALEVKSVPSLIFNMVVANEVRKNLGAAISGSYSGATFEGIKEFFYTGNLWLLNVPSRYADTGVILPVMDAARRNIKFLQVYRHAKDAKPFILGNF